MTQKTGNSTWEDVRDRLLADDAELREAYEEGWPAFLVARELLRARRELGLSQAELARRMGTSQSVISRLERMDTIPNLRTVAALARALGRDLEIRFVLPQKPAVKEASELDETLMTDFEVFFKAQALGLVEAVRSSFEGEMERGLRWEDSGVRSGEAMRNALRRVAEKLREGASRSSSMAGDTRGRSSP